MVDLSKRKSDLLKETTKNIKEYSVTNNRQLRELETESYRVKVWVKISYLNDLYLNNQFSQKKRERKT